MARYIVRILFVLSVVKVLRHDVVEEHKMVEYENEEKTVATRSHNIQCLKCYPVFSQAKCGRRNMLKHMIGSYRDYSFKPHLCEQCVKTFDSTPCGKRDKLYILKWYYDSVFLWGQ
jgi:hypothetical protein